MNREQWLTEAIEFFRPIFKAQGYDIPKVKVSVGFPSTNPLGRRKRAIGECWPSAVSGDKHNHVFISPILHNPLDKKGPLEVLVHELCHAVDDCKSGHGKEFGRIAKSMGLVGKMTATEAGEDLLSYFDVVVKKLGAYPMEVFDPSKYTKKKKQTTRLLKAECEGCGYTVRVTKKWVEAAVPICPYLECPLFQEDMVMEVKG